MHSRVNSIGDNARPAASPILSSNATFNDDDDEFDDAASIGEEWRDRYRLFFANLPCKVFHVFVLVATLFLFCVGVISARSTQAGWYHALEAIVMLIFLTEVISRVLIARGHYFSSRLNVVEAGICAFCTVDFVMLVSQAHASRAEHEIFMGFRYVAQLLRVSVYLKSAVGTVAQTTGAVVGVPKAGGGEDICIVSVGAQKSA